MLSSEEYGVWPLVDPATLADLEYQLDNRFVARSFATDFGDTWERRFAGLSLAVEKQDRLNSLDAVLSLKTASTMVGAKRLARVAEDLESLVRRSDLAQVTAALGLVWSCGFKTKFALLALCRK